MTVLDVRAVLLAHRELAQLLDALAALSTTQAALTDAEEWARTLDAKQPLLDRLVACAPANLFQATIQLLEAPGIGDGRIQEALRTLLQDNQTRLLQVLASEQAAQRHARTHVDELAGALQAQRQQRQVAKTYQPTPTATPAARFLDGHH